MSDRRAGAVVDVDAKAVAALAASVAGVVILFGLARSIPRTLAAFAIAALLALGLDPAIGAVQRRTRLPRAAALGALAVAFVIVVGALALWLVPAAVSQARHLDDDLPRALADLTRLPLVGDALARANAPARLQHSLDALPSRMIGQGTPLVSVARSAAQTAVAAFVTLMFAMSLALDGPRLVSMLQRAVPERHRERACRVGDIAYRAVGRYVTGSLFVAAVAGAFVLTVGLILRVPLAPLLAVWVMVWDLVPQIGGAAGGIPFVAFAFSRGAVIGLIAAVAFVLYLQIENNVLSPLLVGNAIKLSPPATMTAALIGVSGGGVVGALLAVPLAGAAKAIYLEVRRPATARR